MYFVNNGCRTFFSLGPQQTTFTEKDFLSTKEHALKEKSPVKEDHLRKKSGGCMVMVNFNYYTYLYCIRIMRVGMEYVPLCEDDFKNGQFC
jgi:hypothetical protein